jgi:hypothetical protein
MIRFYDAFMKNIIFALICSLIFVSASQAEEVYKIRVEKDFRSRDYSDNDMKRRIWELERAVWQLQQRVFQLESKDTVIVAPSPADGWVCTVDAMGDKYAATGASKAVASFNAIEKCRAERKDGFFCKNPKCEN